MTEWRFNRQELAGSLGDLGTLLPIAIGLILINGLPATPVFIMVGLFYVLSAMYFRCVVPVQPMKAIGAYAIALAMSPAQISLAGFFVGVILLLLAVTGAISLVGKMVPKSTVRGVQLTVGVMLFVQGVRFMLGETALQLAHNSPEPFLAVSAVGPLPIGIVLGVVSVVLILLLLDNRVIPAALLVIGLGIVCGLALGGYRSLAGVQVGFHLPDALPHGWPTSADALLALTVLALPQLPMTIGNAVISQADLTREYFGQETARRMSLRALSVSMGLINVATAFLGGMPMCHGAGGLAAHYRFGARTPGSNLMIGAFFLVIGLLFGEQAAALLSVLPLSVLGALLVFAGTQLALTVQDVKERKDLFVIIAMLGVALATNLAISFAVGIGLAYLLKFRRVSI